MLRALWALPTWNRWLTYLRADEEVANWPQNAISWRTLAWWTWGPMFLLPDLAIGPYHALHTRRTIRNARSSWWWGLGNVRFNTLHRTRHTSTRFPKPCWRLPNCLWHRTESHRPPYSWCWHHRLGALFSSPSSTYRWHLLWRRLHFCPRWWRIHVYVPMSYLYGVKKMPENDLILSLKEVSLTTFIRTLFD